MIFVFFLFLKQSYTLIPETLPSIQPWSQWAPAEPNIVVPPQTVVLLDTSLALDTLLIKGTLVVSPNMVGQIALSSLAVAAGGALYVGTPESPVTGQWEIALSGARQPNVSPRGHGQKSLGVESAGTLSIYGRPVAQSWTVLAKHAKKGDSSVVLAHAVADWRVLDEIVVGTTDFEEFDYQEKPDYRQPQSERVTITAVSGNIVSFTPPLQHDHYGDIYVPEGAPAEHGIDMRAAVGLLTRNVVLHGDDGIGSKDEWGAHVIFHHGSNVSINYLELHHVGQARELGRYPLHAHVAGDMMGSQLVGNSIHDSYQRCITVHGAKRLLLKDNVCFNNAGHNIFVEDGNEEYNIFDHNLVVQPSLHALLGSDREPACFWITNPRNHFFRNRAVGGKFGFWYAMPEHPFGFGKTLPPAQYMLRWLPMGDFKDNTAQSARTGVFIDRGQEDDEGNARKLTSYSPRDYAIMLEYHGPNSVYARGDYERGQAGVPVFATFVGVTVFKCGDGFWYRGDSALLHKSKFADNQAAVTMPGNDNVMQASVIIGDTDNIGEPECSTCPSWVQSMGQRTRSLHWWYDAPMVGYRSYDASGGDVVVNVTFYNFNDETFMVNGEERVRSAGALSGLTGPNVLNPNNIFARLAFHNVANRVFLPRYRPHWDGKKTTYIDLRNEDDAMRGIALRDLDGSSTGMCGATIVGTSAHINAHCTEQAGWNAWLCSTEQQARRYVRHVSVRTLNNQKISGSTAQTQTRSLGMLTNLRTKKSVGIVAESSNRYEQGGVSYEDMTLTWGTNILVNDAYAFTFGDKEILTYFAAQVDELSVGERVRMAMPLAAGATIVVSNQYNENDIAKAAASLADLSMKTPFFHDKSAQLLWLHFETSTREFTYRGLNPHYPQQTQYRRFIVRVTNGPALGAGFDLLGRASASPAAAGLTPPARDDGLQCGKNGPPPLNGDVAFTVGETFATLFGDGAWVGNWDFWGDKLCSLPAGATDLMCDFTRERFFGMGWKWWEVPQGPSIAGATHLYLRLRVGDKFAPAQLNVRLLEIQGNAERGVAEVGSIDTQVASPFHNPGGLISHTFREFFVPLKDMNAHTFAQVQAFTLYSTLVRPVQFHISDIKFVSATRTVVPTPGYPSLMTVPAPTSSYKAMDTLLMPSGDTPDVDVDQCVRGSMGCVCGEADLCGDGLLCSSGVCVNACSAVATFGCPCGPDRPCADTGACSAVGVCFDAFGKAMDADGNVICPPGEAGCPCDAGTCHSAVLRCRDKACRLPSCIVGELACNCNEDETCNDPSYWCTSVGDGQLFCISPKETAANEWPMSSSTGLFSFASLYLSASFACMEMIV